MLLLRHLRIRGEGKVNTQINDGTERPLGIQKM